MHPTVLGTELINSKTVRDIGFRSFHFINSGASYPSYGRYKDVSNILQKIVVSCDHSAPLPIAILPYKRINFVFVLKEYEMCKGSVVEWL